MECVTLTSMKRTLHVQLRRFHQTAFAVKDQAQLVLITDLILKNKADIPQRQLEASAYGLMHWGEKDWG